MRTPRACVLAPAIWIGCTNAPVPMDAAPALSYCGCSAPPAARLFAPDPEARLATLDLDGDQLDDALELRTVAEQSYVLAIRWGAGGDFEVRLDDAPQYTASLFLVTVTAFDADGDGNVEVVIGAPWEAIVWLIPARRDGTSVSVADALASFETPYDRGFLGTWFGYASAAGDLDGDGLIDVAISTPSYGEVGFLGAEDIRVFRGPHAGHRLGDTADFKHPIIASETLAPGQQLAMCPGHVVFSAGLSQEDPGDVDWAFVRTRLEGAALTTRERCDDFVRDPLL